MIKILKRGEVPKNPIVRFKCDFCGTEFEADELNYDYTVMRDFLPFDYSGKAFWYRDYTCDCPMCGYRCHEDDIHSSEVKRREESEK